jgi:indole-3-glycerol phosphate synthase
MILDTIVTATRKRVEIAKQQLSPEKLKSLIYDGKGVRSFHGRNAFAFERALNKNWKEGPGFICEVKRASPSKGMIAEDFPYLEIALEYEKAGADAISVLTEPDFFKGSDQYLSEISSVVELPVLRKDFIIEEYQIYEAKLIGADALLLICSLLDTNTLRKYMELCNELGLSALFETHTKEEIQSALEAGARMIGVNNRNLQTFEVDLYHSVRLRELVPEDIIFVAESGVKTSEDIKILKEAGVNAVLIGETLMRSDNKKEALNGLKR